MLSFLQVFIPNCTTEKWSCSTQQQTFSVRLWKKLLYFWEHVIDRRIINILVFLAGIWLIVQFCWAQNNIGTQCFSGCLPYWLWPHHISGGCTHTQAVRHFCLHTQMGRSQWQRLLLTASTVGGTKIVRDSQYPLANWYDLISAVCTEWAERNNSKWYSVGDDNDDAIKANTLKGKAAQVTHSASIWGWWPI